MSLFDEVDEVRPALIATRAHTLHPDVCFLYYSLSAEFLGNKTLDGIEGQLYFMKGKKKYYFFTTSDTVPDFKAVHYSDKPISKTTWSETVYDLHTFANRDLYKNKKSYYNAVNAPTKYFEKNGLRMEVKDKIDTEEVKKLYFKWVDQKVERGVHKISFPVGRYRHIIENVNSYKNVKVIECRNPEGELVAFRVILIEDEYAYDLVFCSDLDVSQLSNAFNFLSLMAIKDLVRYFNCGPATGKLKQYKHQYPYTEQIVYVKDTRNE